MISFKEFLTEGKVHIMDSPYQHHPFKVFQNPNKEQMKNLARFSMAAGPETDHGHDGHVRIHRSGNDYYAWNASEAIHHHVEEHLGFKGEFEDRGRVSAEKVLKHNGDIKVIHALHRQGTDDSISSP